MIITVTFKTPDAVDDAIREQIREEHPNIEAWEEDHLAREAHAVVAKWVRYSECVRLEFDTEAKTAKVVER